MKTLEEQLDKIWEQCKKRRLDQNEGMLANEAKGWSYESRFGGGGVKPRATELLALGYKVKGGYFTTSVRGYHDYALMYNKGRKKDEEGQNGVEKN